MSDSSLLVLVLKKGKQLVDIYWTDFRIYETIMIWHT